MVLAIITIVWSLSSKQLSDQSETTSQSVHIIEVVSLDKQVLHEKVPLLGTIFAINAVEIKPESEGKIKLIHVKSGQIVKEGQVLVVLDNRHQLTVVKR